MSSDVVFVGPPGVSDLHGQYVTEDGVTAGIRTVWELTDEERRAIASGRNLAVTFWGRMPPTTLDVADEVDVGVDEDDPAVRARLERLRRYGP